ncbi:hypothetical protein VSR01_14345 [Actinacidiphila sp. DG2A-62]|uniref:hypothetical protein n=1 Tax=Actinacidiphila sp. DG2A-62 TaxID=3108821 RepID=UPI002DBC463A|nr:hypothetical protein [Actinacidiphila sp. DG2A-62]MEC3994639.1 hypothetical protein [Actinacidiphila sp. DG2A-62]
MPDRFRWHKGDDARVKAWIVQGAERLGLEELYRAAAFVQSYRRLWLAGLNTPEQDAAHASRFLKASRLVRAEEAASVLLLGNKVSDAALARSARPLVEGRCRCGGTGWLGGMFDPDDSATCYLTNCPGHNPEGRAVPALGVAV